MPFCHAAAGLACGNENTGQSSNSVEDLVISEGEANQDDQGDSQDEDCGLSDYETESDESHKEVIQKETPVQEKTGLIGKSAGISCLDSDESFRTRLDLEFKKYKEAKTRFLLSLVHDNKSTKCRDDENQLGKVYALFGDEIIILRDLNDNVDNKIRSGTKKEKKSKRDGNPRTKPRSRTSSRENALDAPFESDRSRTQSETDHNDLIHGRDLGVSADNAIDGNSVKEELALGGDDHDAPAEHFQFEEHLSPELDAERERRAKLRKMYRWERFQFGRFALDAKSINQDAAASTHVLDDKIEFKIPHKQLMTKQERRENIGDSLFKEECHTNVCYIDSKDSGLEQRILPIITASNYQKVLMPEPPLARTAIDSLKDAPVKAKSKTLDLGITPAGHGAVVEVGSEIENVTPEELKKAMKDKKKKKRKSSSSSEDLEELERKSEARLGKRK